MTLPFWNLPASHRKSLSVTIRQLSIHWNVGTLVASCPSWPTSSKPLWENIITINSNYLLDESNSINEYCFCCVGTTQALLGPPTKFTSQPQSGNPQVLGSSKFLVCGANGNPSPTYRWKKDGRFLPSEFNGSSLKIKTMQKSSVGLYQCVASNVYGAILSSTASVQVACEY